MGFEPEEPREATDFEVASSPSSQAPSGPPDSALHPEEALNRRQDPVFDRLRSTGARLESSDPDRAACLLQLAERLETAARDRGAVGRGAGLEALALAEMAEAESTVGHTEEALRLLRRAADVVKAGGGRSHTSARLFEAVGSLLVERGKVLLAQILFVRSAQLHLDQREPTAAGRVLLSLASTIDMNREPRLRLEVLLRSLELLDPLVDRRVARRAIRELIRCVVCLGWTELAAELLDEVRASERLGFGEAVSPGLATEGEPRGSLASILPFSLFRKRPTNRRPDPAAKARG